MKLIDKDALVAEVEKLEKEASERLTRPVECSIRRVIKDKTYVGLCRKILDIINTLEVIEIGVDVDSPEDDLGRKTVQVIDADGNISEVTFNKAQKGE